MRILVLLLLLLVTTGGRTAPLPLGHPAAPAESPALARLRLDFLEGRLDLFGKKRSDSRHEDGEEDEDATQDDGTDESDEAFTRADLAGWAARARGRELEAFEHWHDALKTGHVLAELVLSPLLELEPGMAAYERLLPTLERLSSAAKTPPLLAARCAEVLGELQRSLGKESAARTSFARLGRVSTWSIIGPFPNAQKTGFDRVFPPEERLDPTGRFKGKRGSVTWRRLPRPDYDGQVDLAAFLRPATWSVAYGLVFCRCPDRRTVVLRASANDSLKLWCNGRLLLSSDRRSLSRLDQHGAVAELAPGWNAILCKVPQEAGSWELGLRITDLDGRLVGDLQTRAEAPPGWRLPLVTPGPVPLVDRGGAIAPIRRWREERPADPWPLFLEARWLEDKSFRERAIRAYERLCLLAPSCPVFWSRLGALYGEDDQDTQSLHALTRALGLDGRHAPAQLALARRYRKKKLLDKARALLEDGLRHAPGHHSARALLASIYRSKEWSSPALSVAESLVASVPSSPLAWSTLARVHLDLNEPARAETAMKRSLALEADDRSEARRLAFHQHMTGRSAEACRGLKRQLALYPLAHELRLDLARIHRATGDFGAALARCDEILALCPRHAEAHETRGRVLLRAGRQAEAVQAFRSALRWRPDDLELKEYLAFLAPEEDDGAKRYLLDDGEIARIIAAAPGPEAHPRATGLVLENRRVEEVRDDGSSIVRVHVLVKILSRRGKKKYGQIRLGNPRHVRLHRARVHRPDGSILEASAMRGGTVTFPSLSVGSVIEYRYDRHDFSGGWLEDHFSLRHFLQKLDPVRHVLLVVDMPEDRPLTVYRKDARIVERRRPHGDRVVWEWEAHDLEALHVEDHMPPVQDLAAQVFVTTIPSWDYLARWQNSLISDQFETNEAIRAEVKKLVEGLRTPMEKLRAIYDFVVREIRYENLDVGIFGKKPDKAVNVFADRFGDCKDKATLLCAMLAEVGIRSHYAAIRTNDRGRLISAIPAPQTNHIINWIPAQEGIETAFFCDATTRYDDLHTLRPDDQGVKAFVLTGDGHRFVDTPVDAPERNRLSVTYDGALRADRSLVCTATFRATGWLAAAHRQRFRNEGKRRELFEAVLNGVVPGAQIDRIEFSDLEDLATPVEIRAAFTVPDYLTEEGTRALVFRRPHPLRLLDLAPRKTRHNAYFRPRTYVTEVEENFELPPGWTLARPSKALLRKGPRTSWEQEVLETGVRRHHVRRRFRFDAVSLPRKRYDEIRNLVVEVGRLEAAPLIVLRPAPGTTP